MLPRLFFLVLETLVDNRLTIRSRIVSMYNAAQVDSGKFAGKKKK